MYGRSSLFSSEVNFQYAGINILVVIFSLYPYTLLDRHLLFSRTLVPVVHKQRGSHSLPCNPRNRLKFRLYRSFCGVKFGFPTQLNPRITRSLGLTKAGTLLPLAILLISLKRISRRKNLPLVIL